MRTITILSFFLLPLVAAAQIRIAYNEESAPLRFGLERIREALEGHPVSIVQSSTANADIRIIVDKFHDGLIAEGYEIIHNGGVMLNAVDASGAMYGALDIAQQLQGKKDLKSLRPKKINPHFSVRALKFNLPWSPYRTGPSMQLHMDVCRDLKFWQALVDQMAENRFNVLSLWNVHPFSYMVKPTNFPHANNFSDAVMKEWKDFWTSLFRMCRERGIEPFVVNWNIAVSPEFAAHYQVSERNDTSSLVRRYTREVVTQVIDEYPDLGGIGITLADWMSNFRQPGSSLPEMTPADREDWISETVVAGMKDAKRPVRFLHRSVLSADPMEMRRVIDDASFRDTTLVEIKFNWSHGHSSPHLLMTHDQHSGKVENNYWDPLPENYRIQWMVRNEDFFILRWGQPDFVRKHISENSKPYVNGYFVGSEGYIPAKDYSHRPGAHVNWKYAFEKQWLFYEVWGKLLYDPSTPDEEFASSFRRRYGVKDGLQMLRASARAGAVPLHLASFHAATWDYTLYSEAFLAPFPSNGGMHDTISSFISIDELIHHRTLDPKYVSIEDYVEQTAEKQSFAVGQLTPIALASLLEEDSKAVIAHAKSLRPASGALACELDDLETWAHLGLYFADKLRAGVALHTFRYSGNDSEKLTAIERLKRCLKHWQKVSEITDKHYKEVPYIDHLGYGQAYKDATNFSWKKYLPQVERDIQIAKHAQAAKRN